MNENVLKILSDGLKPILCVGETQEEYNLKLNTQICAIQLSKGLKSVTKEQMKSVTIAYEPVRARARRHAGQPRGGAWGAGQGGAQGRAGRARRGGGGADLSPRPGCACAGSCTCSWRAAGIPRGSGRGRRRRPERGAPA